MYPIIRISVPVGVLYHYSQCVSECLRHVRLLSHPAYLEIAPARRTEPDRRAWQRRRPRSSRPVHPAARLSSLHGFSHSILSIMSQRVIERVIRLCVSVRAIAASDAVAQVRSLARAVRPLVSNVRPMRTCESLRGVSLPNTTIDSVTVVSITGPQEGAGPGGGGGGGNAAQVVSATFCRVFATVTHPPAGDRVQIWNGPCRAALPDRAWARRQLGPASAERAAVRGAREGGRGGRASLDRRAASHLLQSYQPGRAGRPVPDGGADATARRIRAHRRRSGGCVRRRPGFLREASALMGRAT